MLRAHQPARRRAHRGALPLGAAVWASLAVAVANGPAQALTINASYDASVYSAPSGFQAAVQEAISFFQSTFSDPITVTIGIGWGEIAGYSIAPGALGESGTNLAGYYSYNQVRTALINDAKTSADSTAVGSLPSTDPTGGKRFVMGTAEAKALGLSSYGGVDGYVGFDKTAPWTFDPNNRKVSGEFDLIGVAEHEISEVLGRFADLGDVNGSLDPLDLFRYQGQNSRALIAGYGQYFSINSGATNITTFNGPNGGDLGDWANSPNDAFNFAGSAGTMLTISPGDITELDVIGYNAGGGTQTSPSPFSSQLSFPGVGVLVAVVPEPGSLPVLLAALLGLVGLRGRQCWRSVSRRR